jgi:hypothetical protein
MNTDRLESEKLPHQPTTKASVRDHRFRHRKHIIVASCAVVVAFATLAWHTGFALPSRASFGKSAFTGTGREAGVSAQTVSPAPARLASRAASSAAPRAAPDASGAITRQLAELKAAYERLVQQSHEADERIAQVEADLAGLKQQVEKSQAAHAKAQRQARQLARQLHATKAAAPETPALQQPPTVLSVDTWNGRPSVSVQVGAEVRFLAEGDTVANALLRKADPATQQVEFVSTSGLVLPTRAAAGEGR